MKNRYAKFALYGVVSWAASMGIFLILRQLIYNAAPDFYARNLLVLGDIRPRETPAVSPPPASTTAPSKSDTSNELSGVGIQLGLDEKTKELGVVFPIDGSPASRAGIQPKDIIVTIDGKSTKGMSIEEAANLIRGKAGSTVKLTLRRENVLLDIPLVRERIALPAGEEVPVSDNKQQPDVSAAPPSSPQTTSTNEGSFQLDCASVQNSFNQRNWNVPTQAIGYENSTPYFSTLYKKDQNPNRGFSSCKGGYVKETSPMGTRVCQASISFSYKDGRSESSWSVPNKERDCRWQ